MWVTSLLWQRLCLHGILTPLLIGMGIIKTFLQVPCEPDMNFYRGGAALRVDAYKQDGSWIRLQPVQTLLPLSAISVQTSAEAVVKSTAISTELSCASVTKGMYHLPVKLEGRTWLHPGHVFASCNGIAQAVRWLHRSVHT